jgi:hypothetical protein
VTAGMVWWTELARLKRLVRLAHHLSASTGALNASSELENKDAGPAQGLSAVGDAQTWAGVASRLLEIATEDWEKLARVCILLLCLTAAGLAVCGVAWWWLR